VAFVIFYKIKIKKFLNNLKKRKKFKNELNTKKINKNKKTKTILEKLIKIWKKNLEIYFKN